jgi:hypothetical protein
LSSEGPDFESNECIDAISKRMHQGRIKRMDKPRRDVCGDPSCSSFKVKHNFACVLKTNEECDSNIAFVLNGRFTSRIINGLILDGQGRGAHHGKFEIAGTKLTRVDGILGGITNAGTHHRPFSNAEPCNVKGHMEGRLVGKITRGTLKGGRIYASYVIRFNHSKEFTDTTGQGELEGIIVRDCTSY